MPTPTIRITETLRSRMSAAPPYTAQRVLEVSFENYATVPSEVDVLTAVDNSGSPDAVERVPQAYDVHPRNVELVCKGPALAERRGPFFFVVQCDYDFNGSPALGTVNPLSLPSQYTWSTITVETEADTDASGRLICDSAGNIIRESRPYVLKGLRVQKYFRNFDSLWWGLENTVNSGPVTISGIPVAAEHMLCTSINPEPFYLNSFLALAVSFDFQIVLADKLLGISRFPFAIRALDAGRAGWYTNSGTKNKLDFSDGKGNLVSDDVLLSGDGRPLTPPFGFVKVGPENKDPATPPAAFPAYNQDVGTVYPNAVFRYFEKYPKANHAALPIW